MEAIFSPGLLGFQAGLVRKLLHWIFSRLDTANRAEKCWLISGQGLTLSMNACYLNRKLSFLRLESQHLHFEGKILDQVRFEGFSGTCASLGWMMMVPTILRHDLTSTLRNLWCNDAVASDDHVDDNDVEGSIGKWLPSWWTWRRIWMRTKVFFMKQSCFWIHWKK